MRIMEVVGRADTQIVNLLPFVFTAQLLQVPVETLEFCKEGTVWEVAIENTDGVVLIQSGNQLTTCVLNCLEVSWRNVTGSAGECEVFQEMPMSLAILIVAHSVDSAVGYVDIQPLRVHSVGDLVAHHTHSSNQFDEQEHQPSAHSLGHLC